MSAAIAMRPARGAWVTIVLTGTSRVVRFVRVDVWRSGTRWWVLDRGAYGACRDDEWIRDGAIVSVLPAQRPKLLLSFKDPYGKTRCVGRYVSHEDALAAMEFNRDIATDVRIEAVA